MKIEKQLPVTNVPDVKSRPQAQVSQTPVARPPASDTKPATPPPAEKLLGNGAGFNLQLNHQLSAMQLAERYLSELSTQLAASKLIVSRQLSSAQAPGDKEKIVKSLEDINASLRQRGPRSGGTVDATFSLQFNEPLRSRFSLQGLDSIEAIQRSGRETLLISAGSATSEPLALVLDDGMKHEQILRRFNNTLAPVGMRAELDQDGALKFSAPEQVWQKIKPQLKVQGEGKLFEAGTLSHLPAFEEGVTSFSTNLDHDSPRELRQLLDSIVSALDRVSILREQIIQRQEDVREFLARQESLDEKEWAHSFAGAVFSLKGRTASSYAVVSQTVVAQANITRFAVVSLLS